MILINKRFQLTTKLNACKAKSQYKQYGFYHYLKFENYVDKFCRTCSPFIQLPNRSILKVEGFELHIFGIKGCSELCSQPASHRLTVKRFSVFQHCRFGSGEWSRIYWIVWNTFFADACMSTSTCIHMFLEKPFWLRNSLFHRSTVILKLSKNECTFDQIEKLPMLWR